MKSFERSLVFIMRFTATWKWLVALDTTEMRKKAKLPYVSWICLIENQWWSLASWHHPGAVSDDCGSGLCCHYHGKLYPTTHALFTFSQSRLSGGCIPFTSSRVFLDVDQRKSCCLEKKSLASTGSKVTLVPCNWWISSPWSVSFIRPYLYSWYETCPSLHTKLTWENFFPWKVFNIFFRKTLHCKLDPAVEYREYEYGKTFSICRENVSKLKVRLQMILLVSIRVLCCFWVD